MAGLFAVAMVGLMVFWMVAPIIGIIRASMRRARGASSTLAPILAGSCLVLLLLLYLFVYGIKKELPGSIWSYMQLILHIAWLTYALSANRAAAARTTERHVA